MTITFVSFVLVAAAAAAAAKSLQSCPTLCDPIEGSPPGSAFPGILQERTLEWVAISFSSCGTATSSKKKEGLRGSFHHPRYSLVNRDDGNKNTTY